VHVCVPGWRETFVAKTITFAAHDSDLDWVEQELNSTRAA